MSDCPTLAEFRARFPEFDSEPDARVQTMIDDACGYLSDSGFGPAWSRAALYYAAHLLSLAIRATAAAAAGTQPAPSGAVSASSAGGLSISFASPPVTDTVEAWYQSTIYGQQFWAICQETLEIAELVEGSFPANFFGRF